MPQPLYFLPGLMCDQRLWQHVWPQLSPSLVAQSIQFGLHHQIHGMLADIKAGLDLEPVNLVGFSMGGYLSLRYALDAPQAIKKLVLIGATGRHLTEVELKIRKQILNKVKANRYSGISRQRLKQFIHKNHLNGPVVDIILAMDQDLGKATLIAQLEATSTRPSLMDQVHQLNVPTLIIGAEFDQIVPPDESFALAENFNRAEVQIIPNCGHMSPLEAPQQVAHLINRFVTCPPMPLS